MSIAIIFVLTSQVMAYQYGASNENQSAIDAIKKFTNLSDLNLHCFGQLSTNSGNLEIYNSENSFYYVNRDLGIVEGAIFLEPPELSMNILITQHDAEIIAKKFAIDHYNDFTGKNFHLIIGKLIDHDSGGKEYIFMWREFINSIGTPNFIRISVNPESGKIISYRAQQRIIEVSVLPKITREEAIDIAIAQFPG
jgi:hypothetical protein